MSRISKKTFYSSEYYSKSYTAVLCNVPIGLHNLTQVLVFCDWHFRIIHTCLRWNVPQFGFAWNFLESWSASQYALSGGMWWSLILEAIDWVFMTFIPYVKILTLTVIVSDAGAFGKWCLMRMEVLSVHLMPHGGRLVKAALPLPPSEDTTKRQTFVKRKWTEALLTLRPWNTSL